MDDGFGDPLPAGAVARLGSVRLAHVSATTLAFGDDGLLYSGSIESPVNCWRPDGTLHHATHTRLAVDSIAIGESLYLISGNALVTLHRAREETNNPEWIQFPTSRRHNVNLGFVKGKLAMLSGTNLGRRGRSRRWNWTPLPIEGAVPIAAFGWDWIAACDPKGNVQVLDAAEETLVHELAMGLVPSALAISKNGASLAAGFADGRIAIWDVASGKQLSEWPAHTAPVGALAFSHEGNVLASAGFARIRLWNPATGSERVLLPTMEEPPAAISFHPEAPRIVTRTGLSLKEWDAETGVELSEVPARGTWDDGNRMPESRHRFVEGNGEWLLWDTAVGRNTLTVRDQATACAASLDGKLIASAGPSNELRLFEAAGGKRWQLRTPYRAGAPSFVRFLADGSGVLAGRTFEEIDLFDIKDGKKLVTFVGPIAISRDGELLASTSGNGDDVPRMVLVHKRTAAGNWEEWKRLGPLTAAARAIAFAPFGRTLAVATNELLLWKLEKRGGPHARHDASAHELAFSADGRRLATICWSSAATLVWDVPP